MSDVDRKAERIASQIVAYLKQRPHAADTARGILEWWLQDLGEGDLALVERALELLAARQSVMSEMRVDGHRIWRAGPAISADLAFHDRK